ncbi:MAG: lysophospholipid acyltransferase family protein [Boseongicola sp.]
MSRDPTWTGEGITVPPVRIGPLGWVRVALRGGALVVLTFGCLAILLLVRLVERPLHGLNRPWTPHIVQFVSRNAFRIFGIGYKQHGARMEEPGAVVANHSSWLDIFALNAGKRVYFVAKAEVANWPAIGLAARSIGTVFIRRSAQDAGKQRKVLEDRLIIGHKLLFFPEGTSTDGLRVLAFKPTLFAAFFADSLRDLIWVQPATVIYRAPSGKTARFYGWWGDMDFGRHLLNTLAAPKHGSVEVYWHQPLRVSDFADRKAIAIASEKAVRGPFEDPATAPLKDES